MAYDSMTGDPETPEDQGFDTALSVIEQSVEALAESLGYDTGNYSRVVEVIYDKDGYPHLTVGFKFAGTETNRQEGRVASAACPTCDGSGNTY